MPARVVVAAAIILDGRVLAACRSRPPAVAGRWEFPGGKVERGESDADALVRECREELGIEIAVGGLLGTQVLSATAELRLYAAEHLLGYPEARLDHDDVRWVPAGDLNTLRWLPADEPLVPAVAHALRQ